MDKLRTALIEMGVSPVKADRTAIRRLERQAGISVCEMVEQLDYVETAIQSMDGAPSPSRSPRWTFQFLLKALSTGIICASSMAFLIALVRPSYTWPMMNLGLALGVAVEVRGKVNEH